MIYLFEGADGIKAVKGFAYGLLFGFGSPIPGVSAGTMAILLNVYEKFLISVNWAAIKKNMLFTVTFLAGWGVGLAGVSNIFLRLFERSMQVVSFAFIGLIIGCVPMIFNKAAAGKVKAQHIAVFLGAFALMTVLAFYGGELSSNATLEQLGGITPALLTRVFLASFVSSSAMMIPGVGGSLMMFVFGIYTLYIEAIATFDPILLAVFIVSMVLGVLAGIIGIKKLMIRCPQLLYCAILGFILGSLFIIFPGFSLDLEGSLSVAAVVLFALLAYWLSKKG
jgi:putative membrane protein